MLARLARAFESFFGGALAPAADLFRGVAQIALVAIVLFAALRAALSFTAYRNGWETALVVRCPRCRRLVADPEAPACPSGHAVRFPRGAAQREERRRRFPRLRRAAAAYPFLVPAATAIAAALGFRACGVARVDGPLATLTASAAYLFFAAAVVLAGLALSPGRRGLAERALLGGTTLSVLVPAFALALLARGFEPPRPRSIGSIWTTPTATYVSTGGRARRVGEAAPQGEALLVEARAPAFGIVWQGVKGFEVRGELVKWRGRGGALARFLDRWAAPLSRRGVFLSRSTRTVPLPANRRVWIVSEPGAIRFSEDGGFDLAAPGSTSP